ncbi:MAG TPA: hypothetical protein VFA75_19090 [Nevskia sp.]|jgi:hypothetical protein|nr:hypothetical protein [Nevskia sp.]
MRKSQGARAFAALAALAAAPALLPATASASDYTYIEGGFIDRHDYGRDGGGGRVAGSFDIPVLPLAVIGEYTGTDNLDQESVGAIFHMPIVPTLGFFGGATLEHGDRHDETDTGVGFRAGLRWKTIPRLELSPELRFVHLFHTDQTSVRGVALYNFAPHWDLQGALQGGDDRRYEVGVRYVFGDIR